MTMTMTKIKTAMMTNRGGTRIRGATMTSLRQLQRHHHPLLPTRSSRSHIVIRTRQSPKIFLGSTPKSLKNNFTWHNPKT